MTEPVFVRVLHADALPRGRMRCVEVAGREVLLCATGDAVYALGPICSHAHSRMDEGRLRNHRLVCALHGASFDVRNGAVLGGPAAEPLPSFPCRRVDGFIEVGIPSPANPGE